MVRTSEFEKMSSAYDTLIASQPVGRTALINAIHRVEDSGAASVASSTLSTAEYAGRMVNVYEQASSLEVKPPLTGEQRSAFAGKVGLYEMLAKTQNTDDAATEPTPTNTAAIPTGKRKA